MPSTNFFPHSGFAIRIRILRRKIMTHKNIKMSLIFFFQVLVGLVKVFACNIFEGFVRKNIYDGADHGSSVGGYLAKKGLQPSYIDNVTGINE
jgi:hypothetical protein